MQVLIWFGYLSVFVDASEISVMADDVATPLNPPVAPVEQEELEEAPLDMNVFQRPRKEEPSRRVVRTRIDRLAWDRRLFPNPRALAIYLEFVPTRGVAP
jgi:transposase